MAILFQKAQAVARKSRILIGAPSGFGKTYSALLLAKGMSSSWDKILVVDTENKSSTLYANKLCGTGPRFFFHSISGSFEPEKFIEVITEAEKQGFETVIIDSSSHEWEAEGGCLALQQMLGGRYTDWKPVKTRHAKFISAITNSSCNIICTARGDDAYTLEGKTPVKVGMGIKQEKTFEFEFDISFMIGNKNHLAIASKDRTFLWGDRPPTVLTEEHGRELLEWATEGANPLSDALDLINRSTTLTQLNTIWSENKSLQTDELFKNAISTKKQALVEEKELQNA